MIKLLKKEFRLSKDQVISLCDFINKHISLKFDKTTRKLNSDCDHTFKWTKEWINQNNLKEKDVFDFCNKWGGRHCDCEILLNVPNSYDL